MLVGNLHAATPTFTPAPKSQLTPEQVKSRLKARKQMRQQIMDASPISKLKSAPRWNDQVRIIMENREVLQNIFQMHDQKLTQGRVEGDPWSDSYWPIKKGMLGNRYADNEFNQNERWDDCLNYVKSNPADEIFEGQDEARIAKLAPAEKYDLLFGPESDLNLTVKMWAEGKRYFDRYGEVESWMGICHGWAPASYMVPRPEKSIQVMSYDGKTKIKFFPSDLKALASLLWAKARFNTLFVGGRCNTKLGDVGLPESERERLDDDCIDTNPATWHLTTVNKVGRFKESFVIDATYDYEVWNQPMIDYHYSYFNPKTGQDFEDLKQAIVLKENYPEDPYQQYRHGNTQKMVGIKMTIVYGSENIPNHAEHDDPMRDWTNRVSYQYDLELDENGIIIGGEWHHDEHPDFLWTPVKGSDPQTPGDHYVKDLLPWDGKSSLPKVWQRAARQSNSLGLPISKLVKDLIDLSRKN